jgi:dipeptidase E
MLILTSNGLSSSSIIQEFQSLFKKSKKSVGIVVTADPVYRERDFHAVQAMRIFESIGFHTSFLDLDFDSSERFFQFDVIYFIGGNPYYLLRALRKTQSEAILRQCMKQGCVISGASAGSMVLINGLAVIDEFDPQLNNKIEISDIRGLQLAAIDICPHYTRFQTKYVNFEERLSRLEHKQGVVIQRLNDGEALVIEKQFVRMISKE